MSVCVREEGLGWGGKGVLWVGAGEAATRVHTYIYKSGEERTTVERETVVKPGRRAGGVGREDGPGFCRKVRRVGTALHALQPVVQADGPPDVSSFTSASVAGCCCCRPASQHVSEEGGHATGRRSW